MSANISNYKKTEDSKPLAKGACVSDLESIDKRLGRLRDEVFPISPYLLTVPTDVPFRLGNRFVNNWAVGKDGPFSPEEQQLQYMTFFMHHDVDSLLVAVGDWSDNHGNIMAQDDSKPPSVTSAASTPLSTSTKKKITLSDYNSKAKSGPPAAATSSEEGNVRSARAAEGKQRISKSNSADGTKRQPSQHATSSPQTNGVSSKKKRSLELNETSSKPQEKTRPGSPPPKRPRLSNLKSTQQEPSRRSRATSANNGLPALLSPTLPPSSISPRIPELLSPTLPPDIEEELARLGDNSPAKSLSEKRDSSSIPMTSKGETVKSKGSNRQRPHSASTSSSSNQGTDVKKTETANKSLSNNTKTATRESARKEPAVRAAEKSTQSAPLGPDAKSNASPAGERLGLGIANIKPRLVVRLKYGKSNRKLVEALLRISGKRKLPPGNAPPKLAKEPVHLPAKKEEDQPGSNEILSALKRPRTVDSDEAQETSAKRPKGAISSVLPEKPRTPVLTASKSLSVQQPQQPVTSKTLLSTPKKDIKGAALRQPESGDRDVKTPLGVANKTTPGSVEKPARMSPPPSSNPQVNRSQDTERRAWKEEFQKYANLGRELKHVADRHTRSKASSDNVAPGDVKLAAATAVEAILCFILAFIADDRSKALARQIGDSSTWRSILPYWKVVKITTAPYPHLYGLCLLLGAVSHDSIHSIDLERLAVSSLPGEHSPVPTPGSDGNTVTSEESKQYRKEFLDLKSRLPKYYKEANQLWLEGSRELSEDVLIQEFPITWSKRSINFPERGRQQPKKVGEYPDDFFLPLGRMTTPIEAVRFGLSVLSEWCKKEEVQWEGRFDL